MENASSASVNSNTFVQIGQPKCRLQIIRHIRRIPTVFPTKPLLQRQLPPRLDFSTLLPESMNAIPILVAVVVRLNAPLLGACTQATSASAPVHPVRSPTVLVAAVAPAGKPRRTDRTDDCLRRSRCATSSCKSVYIHVYLVIKERERYIYLHHHSRGNMKSLLAKEISKFNPGQFFFPRHRLRHCTL